MFMRRISSAFQVWRFLDRRLAAAGAINFQTIDMFRAPEKWMTSLSMKFMKRSVALRATLKQDGQDKQDKKYCGCELELLHLRFRI
jgi:hypothetical protein